MEINLNKPSHLMAVAGTAAGVVGAVALGLLFHSCLRLSPLPTAVASVTGALFFSSLTVAVCEMQRELSEPKRRK